jgi:hypothetical protein
MKTLGKIFLIAMLAWILAELPAPAAVQVTPQIDQGTTGVELAQTISLITGVAISPLLGVGAVGAWKYFAAHTAVERAHLPWFAQPWFWIPALILVGACFLKDTVGITLPTLLKKPLDVADAIAHKVSGLVAAGAFVPLIAPIFKSAAEPQAGLLSLAGFASIDPSWIYNSLMIPVSIAAFGIVFLASNAINILILLSPFSTVDAALKGFRLLLLSSVAASAWANPWLGAAWSLIIIVLAYFIAGWSFRLSWFGAIFIWDFVTLRGKRFAPAPTGNKVFLSRKTAGVPARTYGRIFRESAGPLVLKYRPWLFLPQRSVALPTGSYVVATGLIYSEICRLEADQLKPAVLLPPRYRGHEEHLADVYGLAGVRDAGLRKAFKWLKQQMGLGGASVPVAHPGLVEAR